MRLLLATFAAFTLLACHGGSPPETSTTSSGTPVVDTSGPGTKDSSGGSTEQATPTGPSTGNATETNPTGTATGTGSADPVKCGDKICAAGETCISYYGIAGPRGPQFHECGIKCKRGERNDGCPSGKKCVTIADGPGDVCQ